MSVLCAQGDLAGLRALPGARLREAAGAPDAQGFFPLQWAALNNEAEVAELLLANGADVGVRDGTGQVTAPPPPGNALKRAGLAAQV